jgi:hypothetical protein
MKTLGITFLLIMVVVIAGLGNIAVTEYFNWEVMAK